VIDPAFGHEGERLDLQSFEVPLYKSPAKGEVSQDAVGIDPARMNELLKNAKQPPKPEPKPEPQPEQKPKPDEPKPDSEPKSETPPKSAGQFHP
jgi:hypothetical protein